MEVNRRGCSEDFLNMIETIFPDIEEPTDAIAAKELFIYIIETLNENLD
jgi:hypothetical protein